MAYGVEVAKRSILLRIARRELNSIYEKHITLAWILKPRPLHSELTVI